VTPRDSSGLQVLAPATTCSSFRHRWRWSLPHANRPCGSSRDGLPGDATRLNALTPGSAYAGSASVSSSTCEDGDGSTDRACRTVSTAQPRVVCAERSERRRVFSPRRRRQNKHAVRACVCALPGRSNLPSHGGSSAVRSDEPKKVSEKSVVTRTF
jgi:hypothetical protein